MNYRLTPIKPFGVQIDSMVQKEKVSQIDLKVLRDLFLENQLILLRGFSPFDSTEEFSNYCENWGEISLWPFGKVLELIEQENPEDHIFDHRYVPLHWDGMYRLQVPEYQIFRCVKAPLLGNGGRTTFSNTILALKNAPEDLKLKWSQVTGIYKRKMEYYNSKTVSPLITKHAYRDFKVLRYNEIHFQENGHFVNPPEIEFKGIVQDELSEFHQKLKAILYSPNNFYAHEWQDGDIVITDNFSLLHGREEFISKSPRHLQRVQVLSNPPFDNPGLESYQ